MTQRLYYDNAYLTEFDAAVICCRQKDEAYEVLLDQSAFYPTSGGQPFDTGTLNGVQVVDVNVEDNLVWHRVDAPLQEGEAVHGSISWQRRFDHMQQHAADHMIAGALHRMLGGVTIGLHISADVSTIDVAMPEGVTRISPEQIRAVEMDVNEQIQQNVPIRCWFPLEEELERLPLRKKPTVSQHVRVVAIGEREMVACGGTHPSSAGQIGLVKILSVAPARGKMRVTFVAGMRAMRDYFLCHEACHGAAKLLSATEHTLVEAVGGLQEKLRLLEGQLTAMKREGLLARAETLRSEAQPLPGGKYLAVSFEELDAALLRELASKLVEKPGMIALLGAKNGDSAMYVFGRAADVDADMGALLRESAKAFGGKGGGRPDFAQGGGSPEMLQEARRLLLEKA